MRVMHDAEVKVKSEQKCKKKKRASRFNISNEQPQLNLIQANKMPTSAIDLYF